MLHTKVPVSNAKASFTTPSSRWTALTTRNPLATSAFIYAVKTTRIYCRPTCSARLARRANILFYDTPVEAQRAGFRACKRCKPDARRWDIQGDFVAKACALIEKGGDGSNGAGGGGEELDLGSLAKEVGRTKSHFHRVFRRLMGITPKEYGEAVKARDGSSSASLDSASTRASSVSLTTTSEMPARYSVMTKQGRTGGAFATFLETLPDKGIDYIGGHQYVDWQPYTTDLTLSECQAVTETPIIPGLCRHEIPQDSIFPASESPQKNTFESRCTHASASEEDNVDWIGSENYQPIFTRLLANGMSTKSYLPEDIEYVLEPWSFGYVLIAATNRSVCFLDAGDSKEELTTSLRSRFPKTKITQSPWYADVMLQPQEDARYAMFSEVMEALTEPSGKVLNVPLDLSSFSIIPVAMFARSE